MDHCNACNVDVEDADVHIRGHEHVENVARIRKMFQSKFYPESRRGIDS